MKKIFITIVGMMLMTGCTTFTENRESRSTVYEGQTTWDLYEKHIHLFEEPADVYIGTCIGCFCGL